MKTLVVALVILLAPASAQAACHRYSRWAYPYPQSCSIHHKTYTQRLSQAEQLRTKWEQPANIPDIPVLLSDEALRQAAIERLEEAH